VSYRPITDTWILARPKVKYYGAYPNGFLERARVFLPVTRHEPVLHVCGGKAKEYPTWSTLCPNDATCDLDPATKPDVIWNVRTDGVPPPTKVLTSDVISIFNMTDAWRGQIIDRPYTKTDAAKYAPGAEQFPPLKELLANALDVSVRGGRVGVLDYEWPRPPAKGVKSIACIGVVVGFGNRKRTYSVYEKL
jgi:hypothetical protein